jgi:hypothetical protein
MYRILQGFLTSPYLLHHRYLPQKCGSLDEQDYRNVPFCEIIAKWLKRWSPSKFPHAEPHSSLPLVITLKFILLINILATKSQKYKTNMDYLI